MALPFDAAAFDAAVMALVVVFVPEPAKGMDEMVRVVRPGGLIATYVWDMVDGGFPLDPILEEMRAMNIAFPRPLQVDKSRMAALVELWKRAQLTGVDTREITVERAFPEFEKFWNMNLKGSTVGPAISALSPSDALTLKERVRERLKAAGSGSFTYSSRANAIRGYKPG
jgi:SAM-dependent methyltransferase